MKLYYYRGPKPNFGDDLNAWMWPRLLPGLFDDDDSTLFLGIGSIIFDSFPRHAKKIVFGAGYGGYTPLPQFDRNWDIHFVRGHHTARAMQIDPALGIGDAAILLRSCIGAGPAKRYPVSFMPHWESTMDGAWKSACKLASIHYIDPTGTVETVLDAILASDLLITEAMHGAIVADALRIPWIAVTPIQQRHHMKWLDWASALELELTPQRLAPSSLLEACLKGVGANLQLGARLRDKRWLLRPLFAPAFAEEAAHCLQAVARTAPSLSKDAAIERAHGRMLEKMDSLTRRV